MLRGEHRHLFGGVGLLAQASQHRMARGRGLHRRDEGHLVLRAPPGGAARELAAEIRIVDLHPAGEFTPVLAHAHGLHDLVLEQPGGAVAHTELAHQLQRRDVVLGLSEQLHGQEPARQAELAGLEDRSADQAALVGAGPALPIGQAAAHEAGSCSPAAARADKAIGPARRLQRRAALRFGSVTLEELRHRQPRLKLHSVHLHGAPPGLVAPSSGLGGSQREPAETSR